MRLYAARRAGYDICYAIAAWRGVMLLALLFSAMARAYSMPHVYAPAFDATFLMLCRYAIDTFSILRRHLPRLLRF